MTEDIPTKEKLARALEELGDRKLKHVIKRAREGYYDDFESPLVFPSTELFNEMMSRGYIEFTSRITIGEFDSTAKESENWSNSLDGMEAMDDPILVEQARELFIKITGIDPLKPKGK